MSFLRIQFEGAVECPDCELLRCRVWLPRHDEPEMAYEYVHTNDWTLYQCKACRATWSLGEAYGAFDPPPPLPTEEMKGP